MSAEKTVFIKRDGSYYAVAFDSFKYDEKTDSYEFFIPLDKDNSISDSIDAQDLKYLTEFSKSDLESLITFSNQDMLAEICCSDFTGSFIVQNEGLTVDKMMLKKTALNLKQAEFNSDLYLFFSYVLNVLIENDIVKYKKVNLPRFVIPINSVLSSLTYLVRSYALTEDSRRLELFVETVDSLPDEQNPSLESLLTNDTEKMNYAVELIKSKVKADSLSDLEKDSFFKCVNVSLMYYCQPVLEYCAYARAKGNDLFEKDIDLAIGYFNRLLKEDNNLNESELYSEYCYEYASLLLEKSDDDKTLLNAAVEYFKISALLNNSKAKIALYDIFLKKKTNSHVHSFLANRMLIDLEIEGIRSLSLSGDVKQLPEAMIRKGISYFYYACDADTEDEEAKRLNSAVKNYLIGYRALIEKEKQYPDRQENAEDKIYMLKCLDDAYGDSEYDLRASDIFFSLYELNEILSINKKGNDVYFRLSIDDDGKGPVKCSIRMFSKSDNKPLKMCICIPQCWYCDFVTSFEFVDDYIDSLIINEGGICDFDSIRESDMYLDGEFQGSFDGIFKFIADDYIDFEKEVEQLRKDPYVNDIFDESEPLPSYLRISIC